MIVKFIAIICLLLFIPKLEIKKSDKGNNMQNNDDGDEGRRFLNGIISSYTCFYFYFSFLFFFFLRLIDNSRSFQSLW